ncbi:predicted protein [Phaeodactylum tricornutum CCAP 1055/1]|uniref:Uncharacterized protein n=1 Tax=Phaeodactylum tricornutum (strain CCAP 1055/1) TaxID=556484 RepID=B7GBI9_PHATC|nr:predicted protein [Phaeodactylum tricornutum CCAP 1055/1]EEC44127.1 predicted protein [Phaeodactylum tricornutum CCAP 1055/1]|eukprot:XP_002184378.1 predicted protein [Phaeodactylum tricornutum CCAP 1055/1]
MVDSDEDFSLGEEDKYTEYDGCTEKHALEDIGPEHKAKSVRLKSPKSSNQTRGRMPSTLECTNLARQFKEDIPMEEAADEALEMEEADDYDAYKAGLDEGIPPENYPDESGEESDVEDVFGAASNADLKENGDIKDTVQV